MSPIVEDRLPSASRLAPARWSFGLGAVGLLAFVVLAAASSVRPTFFFGSGGPALGPLLMLVQLFSTVGAAVAYLFGGWRGSKALGRLALGMMLVSGAALVWIVWVLSHIPSF